MAEQLVHASVGLALGLVAGSFLATLILRWPEGRSVLHGRSACDGCGRILQPWELVPVLTHYFNVENAVDAVPQSIRSTGRSSWRAGLSVWLRRC